MTQEVVVEENLCPDCGTRREHADTVCTACGAPPGEKRVGAPEGGVRQTDLEPYVALRYIARLFKILAVLMLVMLAGEVITGLMTDGRAAIVTLLGEATRLLVLAGLLWAGGDIMTLLIDAGHDLRVSRILLGRINAQMHEGSNPTRDSKPEERRRGIREV
jgi:hypothetical protein